MTQDWTRMLKSFRAKTYRNLPDDGLNDANCRLGQSKERTEWTTTNVEKPLAVRGRSASEPSFLSASRAVKVRVATSSPVPSTAPPTVKEIGSITGLQQQIKAAFGRWRKRGSPQSQQHSAEEEVGGDSRIREDSFDHPLNVRLSAQSQTFSHPHRLTVFPPFPSGASTTSSSSSPKSSSKSGSHPFAFVRGLRKRRGGEESSQADTESCWTTAAAAGHQQDFTSSFPLTSKSRSDHSLHRILKDDNTWTVFATLRPPSDKGSLTSKGSTTAWTFGLFSDSPSQRQRQPSSTSNKSKSKAASVAPSPELLHRSFTPPQGPTLPGFLNRNGRRTRSLERFSQQRIRSSAAVLPSKPPPVPSRVRSRSLEKNYQISTSSSRTTTTGLLPTGNSASAGPRPRKNNVPPPEVLATWCTFNEAFGGGRPKHPFPADPINNSDERDSPGSPVFEELFLPPPHKFAAPPPPPPLAPENNNNINNNNNKRNSVAGSCCSCGGPHSVSCKSTPRSSPPPPPPPASAYPETVLYGTREAPVLERHCVEGGEFIIAWLSHSKGAAGPSTSRSSSPANRAVPPPPPPPPPPLPTTTGLGPQDIIMQSSSGATTSNGSSSGSNRSFINKPARGWLHSDVVIVREGITYFVRYIGCLEVNTSMKSLDFDTRSQIAKECINVVCETAGLKTVDKKRKVDRRIQRILGDAPHMEHAGSDVALTISSGCLRISTLESSAVVACHDMPNISFASGGDPDTLDFVAYVAKDNVHGRACYVLECGGGLAQDVITTIGQAFELRFKEYLKRTPRPSAAAVESDNSAAAAAAAPPWSPDDPEYYNDLPGKVPPDVGTGGAPPPVPPLPNYQGPATTGTTKKTHRQHVDLSDNLIDLNADVSSMGRVEGGATAAAATAAPFSDHEYVNGIMGSSSSSDFKTASSKDPFDMHPFSAALPSPLPSALLPPSAGAAPGRPVVTLQRGGIKAAKVRNPLEAQLSQELWFHGPISRKEAEDLLKQDGDFLVRESQGSQGQYVLTGMQSGNHKHLLLVDPEGVVRTKDRTFESVSHLINFHRNNVLPIISAESVLLLKRPVPRTHHS